MQSCHHSIWDTGSNGCVSSTVTLQGLLYKELFDIHSQNVSVLEASSPLDSLKFSLITHIYLRMHHQHPKADKQERCGWQMLCEIVLFFNAVTFSTILVLCIIFRRELVLAVNMALNIAKGYSSRKDGDKHLMSDLASVCEGLPPSAAQKSSKPQRTAGSDNSGEMPRRRIKFTKPSS